MEEYTRDESRQAQAMMRSQYSLEKKTAGKDFPAKGADYLRANVPLRDMPVKAAAEIAASMGDSAFLALFTAGSSIETTNFTLPASLPGETNWIKTTAPHLTDSGGLVRTGTPGRPFLSSELRNREIPSEGPNLFNMPGLANE